MIYSGHFISHSLPVAPASCPPTQFSGNLTGGPFKRNVVFHPPPNVRFHFLWWEGTCSEHSVPLPYLGLALLFFFLEPTNQAANQARQDVVPAP